MTSMNDFMNRVEALTGKRWCPYPSDAFMHAIMVSSDDIAKQLIIDRRKYLFPHFLHGEPQAEAITKVLSQYQEIAEKQ